MSIKQQKSFARRLKSTLVARGLRMDDLARALGVNRCSISRAINHPPRNPAVARKVRQWLAAK